MRLLADAHISLTICDFLASAGHDCLHSESTFPGMTDADLLRLAVEQQRVILTSDKDFGELVFRQKIPAVGVILLRFRVSTESERLALFQAHWAVLERSVPGYFVVATNRRVRRTPLPSSKA